MNARLVKLFGWFGIITPVFGFAMIFLAISTAPWFSWEANALSDLGVEGFTATLFNGGLMMTAAVMAMFSLGIYEYTKGDKLGLAAFVVNLASAFFLVGIGFFNENVRPHHYIFSVAFFVALPLSVLIMGAYLLRKGTRDLGQLSVAAGAVGCLIWALTWDGVAIPEAVSAGAAGVWSMALGYRMTRVPDESLEDL